MTNKERERRKLLKLKLEVDEAKQGAVWEHEHNYLLSYVRGPGKSLVDGIVEELVVWVCKADTEEQSLINQTTFWNNVRRRIRR